MRQTCQLSYHNTQNMHWVCGKPAVDYVERETPDGELYKYWLCAEHFDVLMRIRKIFADNKTSLNR